MRIRAKLSEESLLSLANGMREHGGLRRAPASRRRRCLYAFFVACLALLFVWAVLGHRALPGKAPAGGDADPTTIAHKPLVSAVDGTKPAANGGESDAPVRASGAGASNRHAEQRAELAQLAQLAAQEREMLIALNGKLEEEERDRTEDTPRVQHVSGSVRAGDGGALGDVDGAADVARGANSLQGLPAGSRVLEVGPPWLPPAAVTPYRRNAPDDGPRCRQSGICDGVTACTAGDQLGCVTDAAQRQQAVREAALWTWEAYKASCWGEDELQPLSGSCDAWFELGLTLVDGLDTLMLMGATEQVEQARAWLATGYSADRDTDATNLFETTIRILGGLLSAFHLSGGDRLYLWHALDLGLRLLPAFSSPSGIPWSDINLSSHKASPPHWGGASSLSEVSTLDVEFSYLARISGRPELESPALGVMAKLAGMGGKVGSLPPQYVDPKGGHFTGRHVTLGARADSYYEYLLKEWLVTGKRHDWLALEYLDAMADVRARLLGRSAVRGLVYVAELEGRHQLPKMDHLVCFLPGLLALGHLHGLNSGNASQPNDLQLAESLAATCYELYRGTPAGLAPEIAFFVPEAESEPGFPKQHAHDTGGGDFKVKAADAHCLLRPETVESLFILWRVTRKQQYREWGWAVFRAFNAHARVETGGYAALDSVLSVPPPRRDKMDSFWLAETLKYLWLLYDDADTLPLTEFVFSTEAHPIPMEGSAADVALLGKHLQLHERQWKWASVNSSIGALQEDLQMVASEVLWQRLAEPHEQVL